MLKQKSKILFIITFGLFFMFSNLGFAQGNNNEDIQKFVAEMVKNLKQKVLLSDEQANEVTVIITAYITNPGNSESQVGEADEKNKESLNKAKSKLEALLDKKQRMKYDIIKEDWWLKLDGNE